VKFWEIVANAELEEKDENKQLELDFEENKQLELDFEG
jgi:hypothetical protein